MSAGRRLLLQVRRPSVMSNVELRVLLELATRGPAGATISGDALAVIAPHSAPATPQHPARGCRLSPECATISSVGTFGPAAAARPPWRPAGGRPSPSASGMIICARYSSRTASSRCAAWAARAARSSARTRAQKRRRGSARGARASSRERRYRSRGRVAQRAVRDPQPGKLLHASMRPTEAGRAARRCNAPRRRSASRGRQRAARRHDRAE